MISRKKTINFRQRRIKMARRKKVNYEVCYVGPLSGLKGFVHGEWAAVETVEEAAQWAHKRSFKVRDAKTKELVTEEEIRGEVARIERPLERARAKEAREAEKARYRKGLGPSGEYSGEAPHDEGWEPSPEYGDLPPMGVEIKDDEPRVVLKNPRSQRTSRAVEEGLKDIRLDPKEAANLGVDVGKALADAQRMLTSRKSRFNIPRRGGR